MFRDGYIAVDNDLKGRIKFLVRTETGGNVNQRVIFDLLKTYYGELPYKEKVLCEWVIYTVWDTCFSNAPYDEVVSRLVSLCKNTFLDKHDIENTIKKLSADGIIDWLTLLNPVESEEGQLLRIHKWETLNLKPKTIQRIIIWALGYANIEHFELGERNFGSGEAIE